MNRPLVPASRFVTAAFGAALVLGLAADRAGAQSPAVGEVGSVQGVVLATTPGEQPRALGCGDPIFAGDRIATGEASSVGIVSGDFWTGLGAETEGTFDETAAGSPRVTLAKGHLRLIDASAAAPSPAAIYTPGLVALDAGTDTEALAFPEKVGTVAMICGWDDALAVDGAGTSTGSLVTDPGECAIGKPKEAVFAAPAAHTALPVSASAACGAGKAFDVAGHQFLPAVAAAGLAAAPAATGPPVGVFAGFGPATCQIAGCGTSGAVAPAAAPAQPGIVFGPPRPGQP
jgi:hypothetical protein